MVSPTESIINMPVKDLMAMMDLKSCFDLGDYEAQLYTQLRLVARGFQSTTIRLAVQGLLAFEYVRQYATTDMKRHVNDLKILRKELNNMPYTGCCSIFPPKFVIANQADICLFGILIYQQGLTPDAATHFKEYATDKIAEKLLEGDRLKVHMMVQSTPPENRLINADFLERLPLELAESRYNALPEQERKEIYELLQRRDSKSTLWEHLKKMEKISSKARVTSVLAERIIFHRDARAQEFDSKISMAPNQDIHKYWWRYKNAVIDVYNKLLETCKKSDDNWMTKITSAESKQYKTLCDLDTEGLKRIKDIQFANLGEAPQATAPVGAAQTPK